MEPTPISNDALVYNKKPRVCLLGITGHGKSTLGNALCGNEAFKTSGGARSETTSAKQWEAGWLGGTNPEEEFFCLDTCGFGDSEGRDEEQLEALIKNLQTFCYVNTFLVVLNSAHPRLDQQIKKMFEKFKEVFKTKVFAHIVIVYTRWQYSKREISTRKRQNITEELRIKEINEYFKTGLGYDTEKNPIPCLFVDTLSFLEPDTCEDEELQTLRMEFEKMKAYCFGGKQFITMGLEKYLLMKKNLDQASAEDRELYQKLSKQDDLIEELIERHPELEEKITKMKKEEKMQRYHAQVRLDNNIRKYFDNRDDFKLIPSLLNDIWEINSEFKANDTWRIFKGNFLEDMQKYLNEKLYAKIENRLKDLLEEEAYTFLKESESSLGGIVPQLNISVSSELGQGIGAIVATSFAGAGALALAEVGLVAVLGIVGMIAVAAIGIVSIIYSASWSKENEVIEFTKKAVDLIATNELKTKLIDISTKAMDKIMLRIISRKKEALIEQFSKQTPEK